MVTGCMTSARPIQAFAEPPRDWLLAGGAGARGRARRLSAPSLRSRVLCLGVRPGLAHLPPPARPGRGLRVLRIHLLLGTFCRLPPGERDGGEAQRSVALGSAGLGGVGTKRTLMARGTALQPGDKLSLERTEPLETPIKRLS